MSLLPAEDAAAVAAELRDAPPSSSPLKGDNALFVIRNGQGDVDRSEGEGEAFEPLEDLDDDEFDLPHIEFTPTLEEILDANGGCDFEDDVDDAAAVSVGGEGGSDVVEASHLGLLLRGSGGGGGRHDASSSLLESLSVASFGSGGGDSRSRGSRSRGGGGGGGGGRKGKKGERRREETRGAIMRCAGLKLSQVLRSRHVILKGISSQMMSASERVSAGLPTVMASSPIYISVGTSHGFILVFDGSQALKVSLGGKTFGQEFGSVSSLCFSTDSSLLLAGFAKGQLVQFEVASGKLLLSMPDAHPSGSAITHARFTDDSSVALLADSGGSVFEISFRRTLGVRGYNSRCIFSGSRGEVCSLEPLSLTQYPEHDLSQRSIVALVTISKVIVLSLRPTVKVLFTHPLTGGGDTMPVLAWQFVIIQTTNSEKVVDPVLAFGRQSTIFFYQLTENLSRRTVFVPLQRLELNYDILNFGWLNTRCLAILDTTEVFHLYDVKNQEELESVDLADVQIVYGSSFFKGLATGGNVSKAMSKAGERATYGSVSTFTNQMLLLGRRTFHVLVIRTWSERLDHLVKENRYPDALALGCDFYHNQSKTLVGLKGPREKRKAVIAQKVVSILLKYLDVATTKNFPAEGNIHVLSDYFSDVVPPCVSTCMHLKRKDILFDQVWSTYSLDPFAKGCFLESLEPYVLSDQLRNMPASISQEFVSHYVTVRRFVQLEASLTHLLVSSIDIHQVMGLCWLHGMYDVIVHIYNIGMMDYVTPLEELMAHLTSAVKTDNALTQQQINLGNKVLVYISGCLAGRAYPYGEIPSDRIAAVKFEVYNCLTSLHSKRCQEDEPVYPYLRTLLLFDTQGLLNVISIAFEEPDFKTEMGRRRKERLVDILLDVMVKGQGGFTPTQTGHLFTFLARQIARGDKCLMVDRSLFEQVLDILTQSEDKSHHDERQQALLEMLNAGGIQYFDRDKLICQARKVRFYRILEMLYETGREYEKVLGCYIEDDEDEMRRQQAFSFVQKVMLDDASYDDEAKGKVEKSVMKDLALLMGISQQKTAAVIYNHMYSYIPLVMTKLETTPKHLYDFLKHALELKDSGSLPSTPLRGQQESLAAPASSRVDPLVTSETFELFVDLMCRFDASRVCSYLQTKSLTNVEPALKICERHANLDAQAYLLEKDGRVMEAFDLLRRALDARLLDLPKRGGETADMDRKLFWSRVNASIVVIVQLCQRTLQTLSEEERKKLWFSLLDSLMSPQRDLQVSTVEDEENLLAFKEVVRHVVTSTIGYVSLRLVIDKVLRDPIYQAGSFGDIKGFLVEMLETYHYEETLLRSTSQLVRMDLHDQVRRKKGEAGLGVSVRELCCDLCRSHLALQGGQSVAFRCGHKFHLPCLQHAGCMFVTDMGEEKWQCYLCISGSWTMPTAAAAAQQGDKTVAAAAASSVATTERRRVPHSPQPLQKDELEALTNRNLSMARSYLRHLKSQESPLALMKRMAARDVVDSRQDARGRPFHNVVELKLWPDAVAE